MNPSKWLVHQTVHCLQFVCAIDDEPFIISKSLLTITLVVILLRTEFLIEDHSYILYAFIRDHSKTPSIERHSIWVWVFFLLLLFQGNNRNFPKYPTHPSKETFSFWTNLFIKAHTIIIIIIVFRFFLFLAFASPVYVTVLTSLQTSIRRSAENVIFDLKWDQYIWRKFLPSNELSLQIDWCCFGYYLLSTGSFVNIRPAVCLRI